jgi:F-type H+-transporting ATPase subunit b
MDSLISTFHIDIKLLLAQIINFAIVFAVLYFFVLKPLTKVMKDRSDKIEKSLNDAKDIEAKLAKTEEDYMKEITKAKKEAGVILEQAKQMGEENKSATIARAKEEVGQIINQEKQKIQTEKAETLREIKKDVANLVEAALVKLIEEKLNDKKDMEIIRKTIKG